MNRRGFLKLAGSGLMVAAAPAVALAEPVRRFWQVGRGAPVGERRPGLYNPPRGSQEEQAWVQRVTEAAQRLAETEAELAGRGRLRWSKQDRPDILPVSMQTYQELCDDMGVENAYAGKLDPEPFTGKLFGIDAESYPKFNADAPGWPSLATRPRSPSPLTVVDKIQVVEDMLDAGLIDGSQAAEVLNARGK